MKKISLAFPCILNRTTIWEYHQNFSDRGWFFPISYTKKMWIQNLISYNIEDELLFPPFISNSQFLFFWTTFIILSFFYSTEMNKKCFKINFTIFVEIFSHSVSFLLRVFANKFFSMDCCLSLYSSSLLLFFTLFLLFNSHSPAHSFIQHISRVFFTSFYKKKHCSVNKNKRKKSWIAMRISVRVVDVWIILDIK